MSGPWTDPPVTLSTAARLLRAKAGQLEARLLDAGEHATELDYLAADVAFIADLLALALDRLDTDS